MYLNVFGKITFTMVTETIITTNTFKWVFKSVTVEQALRPQAG